MGVPAQVSENFSMHYFSDFLSDYTLVGARCYKTVYLDYKILNHANESI